MYSAFLGDVTRSVASARTLEELTRPLLSLLQLATGLESTYLTHVDEGEERQHVLYTHNAGNMAIPEGLTVPWQDTLCRRALAEAVHCTTDALASWGDVEAAHALGIRTYVTTPVHYGDGRLYGTLCAASTQSTFVTEDAREMLALFGTLIRQQIEREALVTELQEANARLESWSYTDALTGLPNRRFLLEELDRLFALAGRNGQAVLVAFVDLDRFKAINDRFGHDVGDLFLVDIARRLKAAKRAGDQLARIGGDEFVVIGLGPRDPADLPTALASLSERLAGGTAGQYDLTGASFRYAGPSIGIIAVDPAASSPDQALSQADAAMYAQKQARRAVLAA